MQELITQLKAGQDLSADQARMAFTTIMSGDGDDELIAAFLLALKDKGESIEEITAAATVMREHMTRFETDRDCIDVCGTGGDNKGSYNISTAVAFVLAGCGVPVAKHGNRSVSSKSGSSDVLQALGIKLTDDMSRLEESLDKANICFLAAPFFHPAMKHVAPIRAKLKTRTIFNLLGPLCNPAGVTRQVMGVYDAALVEPLCHVLKNLGSIANAVVHGSDGMDELTVTGPSHVAELKEGAIRTYDVTPEDAGLALHKPEELLGGDAEHNADALRRVLSGETGAYRDAVIMNATGGLIVADKADDPLTGAALAAEAINSGRATECLETLIRISNA